MNKDLLEKEALKFSIEHEVKNGRKPFIVTNAGFDIISGERKIEVRAKKNDGNPIILTKENIEALNNKENFWLYVVHMDERNKPKMLLKINKEEIVKRKNEHVYWEFS